MPACTPTDMRRFTLPPGGLELADRAEPLAHAVRRTGGSRGMLRRVVVAEEQHERVAAELQQHAVLDVGDAEQVGEAGVDRVGHLLGADTPELGELLRELREPGDVDEDDRPVDRPVQRVRIVREPLEREPGQVRLQAAL